MFADWANVAELWSSVETHKLYRKLKHGRPTRRATLQEMEDARIRAAEQGGRNSGRCPECNCADTRVFSKRTTGDTILSWRRCRHCGREFPTSESTTVPDVQAEDQDRAKAKEMEDQLNGLFEFVKAEVPQWLNLVPLLDKRRDARTDEEKVRASLELYGNLLQRDRERRRRVGLGGVRRGTRSAKTPTRHMSDGPVTAVSADRAGLDKPKQPLPPVVLRGRHDHPIVRGEEKRKLTTAQFNVVTALIAAPESGLTKDELVVNSGHEDARGVLRRLAESDDDWKAVIHFGKVTGGRYRIG